jgi:hypothetical protein
MNSVRVSGTHKESRRDFVSKPSPVLRGQGCALRLPRGQRPQNALNPNGVAARAFSPDATPLGFKQLLVRFPRVTRASQPWALRRNPFGIRPFGRRARPQSSLRSLCSLLFKKFLSCCAKPSLLPIGVFIFFALTPGAWTQYPFPNAPAPALTGSTVGTDLRNAVAATQAQAAVVRKGAGEWGRAANRSTYGNSLLQQDYEGMRMQFQNLRTQFNWAGSLALQLGRPQANNAVAELDAGLNVIAELFTFLQSQYNAGTLDRNTIVRTARAFEEAMREWERQLRKSTARLGLVW